METALEWQATSIPPIVLLVEDDPDTRQMYSVYLEGEGFWVASSSTPNEALSAVDELKPDLIISDIGLAGEPEGLELVHTLKARPETREIPLILLSVREQDDVPATARAEVDACLVKPVLPDTLLAEVRHLLARSRDLRTRGDRARQKTAELTAKSSDLIARSHAVSARVETAKRTCPACGQRLDWIERGVIGGVEYDYYRWCDKGCGLFCFDRSASRWVKLA